MRQELAGAEGSKRPSEFEAQLAESQEEQARLRRELGQVRQPAAPASGEPPMMVAQGVKRLTEALAAEIKRREGPERQATELGEQRSQLEGQLAQARLRREQSRQELQARAERSATEQTRLEARVAELQSARAEVEKRLQQLTETLTKETESRQDVERRAGQLTQERQQLEAALAENREAQTHLREQAQATEDRLRALQERSQAEQTRLEAGIGQLEEAKAQLEQRLKQLAETLAGERQRRETAEGRIGELDRRRSELEGALANHQQALAALQRNLVEAEEQLERQRADYAALQSEAEAWERRAGEWKAELAERAAGETRLRQHTAELEQRIRQQRDELAAWAKADAAQKADLQRLQATIEELRIIQTALCLRVRDLTAEQERAADRIRQLTDDSREAARTQQASEQELAGLRHAVFEAARIGANIGRERRRAQAQVVDGWRSMITTLLDTPLSITQRGLLGEIIRALDGWRKESEDARGDYHYPVEPPDFLTSGFNCAEVINCALEAVRENACETNRQVRTEIVGPIPERAQGSSAQLHQLITLLAASLPAIGQTDQLEINVSFQREHDKSSRIRLVFLLSSPDAAETARLRLQAVAEASAAMRGARSGGAELTFSSAWQLAQALDGVPVIETVDGRKVPLQVSLPVQPVPSSVSGNIPDELLPQGNGKGTGVGEPGGVH